MNWDNYLLEEKAPCGRRAELGVIEGTVRGIYDLSLLPDDTKILSLFTPLKKTKLSYTNYEALEGNTGVEGICIDNIDEERLAVFATLPNLRYIKLMNNKQEEIPNLSCLQSLEVLILANMARVKNIDFVVGLNQLKTLFISDINNLYDLYPLSMLKQLQELSLENGGMSGVGKPVQSVEPLAALTELQYLSFLLTVENRDYGVAPLFGLKKLRKLHLLPRFLKDGRREQLLVELPLLAQV